MSWADVGLENGVMNNSPISYDHIEAIITAINERIYLSFSDVVLDIPAKNSPIKSDILESIDYYVWDHLGPKYYYFDPVDDQPIAYSQSELESILGERESYNMGSNCKFPLQWINQIINILKLYDTVGIYNQLNYELNNSSFGRGSTWEAAVSDFSSSGRTALYTENYYRAARNINEGGVSYNYGIYAPLDQSYRFVPYTDSIGTYDYLSGTIKTGFFTYTDTVYQPLQNMVQDEWQVWKQFGEYQLNTTITIPNFILRSDFITNNTFIAPTVGTPVTCKVYFPSVCSFAENISFKY